MPWVGHEIRRKELNVSVHRLPAAVFVRAVVLLILMVLRDAGRHRPTRSTIRSSVERFGAPLGPMPAGDPSRRPSPTTRPHHVASKRCWGRVVGLGRETEGGGGPSGARSGGAGTVEGQAGAGWRGDRSPDVCRGGETGAPCWVCTETNDCSRRPRSLNGSGSPSATCGGWDAKASCRGSSCRDASTSGSPRRTSSGSSLVRVSGQRQCVLAVARRCMLRRVGSEVLR